MSVFSNNQQALAPPPPGDPNYHKKKQLDYQEQDICMFNFTPTNVVYQPSKSKELDSGILSLEIPTCVAKVSPPPSPTLSVASSPATFSSRSNTPGGSVTSGISSPSSCSPRTAPGPSYYAAAHDAVALREIKRTFERAQELCPADAAVFVGNLPAGLTDLQLSHELVNHFQVFGHLNVLVSRTYTAEAVKPTAIMQFTHPAAATKAVDNSCGWRIGGRKLRVARSTAHRSLTVWPNGVVHPATTRANFNSGIHADEVFVAQNQFHDYAPFDQIDFHITQWTYMRLGANDGIRITFTNYGQYLRAKRAVKNGALPYHEKKAYRGPSFADLRY
ncbi:uncharacterized protein CLAFUR5_14587 [Fulvia fulva]|uniref:RRM domain-containing protein n=1 Tax=Passalora fulva TaxID=5499 RepID=A0A9Q8UWC7_PASFU|nr:uncharacterized protein CLAFUR5_14587 [Fulvia fulva]UJO24863.1 hypothetical protein CLAFUR5_14587 [Fulvia fulva]